MRILTFGTLIWLSMSACGEPQAADESPPTTASNHTAVGGPVEVAYGPLPEQFGRLEVPEGDGPFAVVVLIHGGFWRNAYDLSLMDPLADDLVERGYAVWNIEYRRVGDAGADWAATLADVAAAIDHLATLADTSPLDLDRVAVVGHSAGGHLALWVAGRAALEADAPGASPIVVPAIAVGQAPVADLEAAAELRLGNSATQEFLGGEPDEVPERYEVATPNLEAGPATGIVYGTADTIVPPLVAAPTGVAAEVRAIEAADHFDVINPAHEAWAAVLELLAPEVGRR